MDLLFHFLMLSLVESCYVPWPGIEPTTLAYQGDALTNWATQPGPHYLKILKIWTRGLVLLFCSGSHQRCSWAWCYRGSYQGLRESRYGRSYREDTLGRSGGEARQVKNKCHTKDMIPQSSLPGISAGWWGRFLLAAAPITLPTAPGNIDGLN